MAINNLIPLYTTKIAPELNELDTNYVRELPDTGETYVLEDLIKMIKICEVNNAAINIKTMRAVSALGSYYNDDDQAFIPSRRGKQTIQEWVRGNFQSMRGSLASVVRKMIRQAYSLGTSVGEIQWESKTNSNSSYQEWRLAAIPVLNPLHYNFAGIKGSVDRIIYNPIYHAPKAIPYSKLLHIYTPSLEEPEDPRGEPASARALPYYKGSRICYKQWTIAGQREATGRTVVKVPSDKTVIIYGSDGKPIFKDGKIQEQPAAVATLNAFQKAENGAVTITDKENDVVNIPGNAGENFFNTQSTNYEKKIFLAYGVPSTIFGDTQSSIGSAGINAGHRLILDTQIEDLVNDLRDQLIEKVIRPLLLANFGNRFEDNLGRFESDKFLDPTMVSMRVSNLTLSMGQGFIDANDLEAINRLREDLGLSPKSKEEFDQEQLAKLLAQQEYQRQQQEMQEQ